MAFVVPHRSCESAHRDLSTRLGHPINGDANRTTKGCQTPGFRPEGPGSVSPVTIGGLSRRFSEPPGRVAARSASGPDSSAGKGDLARSRSERRLSSPVDRRAKQTPPTEPWLRNGFRVGEPAPSGRRSFGFPHPGLRSLRSLRPGLTEPGPSGRRPAAPKKCRPLNCPRGVGVVANSSRPLVGVVPCLPAAAPAVAPFPRRPAASARTGSGR
jgi:hypothetical protein